MDARTHREVQVALLGPDPAVDPRGAQAPGCRPTGSADPPARVRRLPTHARPAGGAPSETAWSSWAYVTGTSSRSASTRDRRARILVLGPAGSGRTSALETLARGFLADGHPLALVGGNWTPGHERCGHLHQDRHRRHRRHRRRVLSLGGTRPEDVERLVTARRRHPDLVVVVDDVERPGRAADRAGAARDRAPRGRGPRGRRRGNLHPGDGGPGRRPGSRTWLARTPASCCGRRPGSAALGVPRTTLATPPIHRVEPNPGTRPARHAEGGRADPGRDAQSTVMTTLPKTSPSTIRANPSRASASGCTESTTGSMPRSGTNRASRSSSDRFPIVEPTTRSWRK